MAFNAQGSSCVKSISQSLASLGQPAQGRRDWRLVEQYLQDEGHDREEREHDHNVQNLHHDSRETPLALMTLPVPREFGRHSSLVLLEQFRQFCEIERHLARLVDRHDAGVPCAARSPAVEHTDLLPSGVLDSESVWELNDPPRNWEACGH
jgi:hypothetical protein